MKVTSITNSLVEGTATTVLLIALNMAEKAVAIKLANIFKVRKSIAKE